MPDEQALKETRHLVDFATEVQSEIAQEFRLMEAVLVKLRPGLAQANTTIQATLAHIRSLDLAETQSQAVQHEAIAAWLKSGQASTALTAFSEPHCIADQLGGVICQCSNSSHRLLPVLASLTKERLEKVPLQALHTRLECWDFLAQSEESLGDQHRKVLAPLQEIESPASEKTTPASLKNLSWQLESRRKRAISDHSALTKE